MRIKRLIGVTTVGAILAASGALLLSQQPRSLSSPEDAAKQAEIDAAAKAEAELEQTLQRLRARREQVQSAGQARRTRDDIPELEDERGRIVNGAATIEFAGVGALVKGTSGPTAGSWCTGTLVGCQTFLTANHCVADDRTAANYQVYFQHAGFVGIEHISPPHREYAFPHADLAVLRLAQPVEGLPVTGINRAVVPDQTPGTLVGFGRTGGLAQDYGVKRRGSVKTAKCDRREGSLLCWDFQDPLNVPGANSNTCNADSGGPLFVQETATSPTRVIAGVTSGGTRRDCLVGDHSYDVDVRQFSSWIAEQAGSDLGNAQCGARPVVGTERVTILAGSGRLEIGQAHEFRVPVPQGVRLLVVALNGTDNRNTNLNLFVKRGTPATSSNSDCARNGTGNYSACSFTTPASGDWFLRVDQQGQSPAEFQVVTTMYP